MDDTDTSLMYTALRETLEETGLIDFKILGPLPHLPDRSATIEVHPYLAYVVSQNSSSASSVEKVLDRAIVEGSSSNQKDFPNFNVDEVSSMTMMQFRSIEGLEVPSWKGPNGQSIWGLTAYILNDLLKKVIAPSS
ncbi:hypothetical protein BC829DRAFT_405280 [Chytridium lagenaria]|nr:hypothetical protein BC829DRAFT_405280 [Chytridium lagenaria]